ncbi:TetR/AcrR family transcriptional regulator [Duganella sp. LX20W]|uniref:TetR/AcrR family transcriptional regulator n=1 Tax=Rugamonas brunnea TaxID=2758569 RepID=A0A7W2ENT5_9BURK|nr:TetR/AcrR family transcriptional regulator [Rugamonas brunnea]MBA5635750.1 TetR/AcrR family transcriptional regulator [Rugamonas brunnea]
MHKETTPLQAPGSEQARPARQSAGKRRIPQQERGIKTIEVILKAAGEEIARGGLAKLTTKRIAEAAGLSVGGLYEYFPNKESVVHALASQWLERVKDAVEAIHPSKTGCVDLIRYLNMVYDAVRPLYQQVPGVSVLISLLASVPALTALEEEIDLQVNALLTDAMSALLPYVSREQCSATARTITILDHHLLIESLMRGAAHSAFFDTNHRICRHALASHLMLLNEQAQPASWAKPRPEAPPDVI